MSDTKEMLERAVRNFPAPPGDADAVCRFVERRNRRRRVGSAVVALTLTAGLVAAAVVVAGDGTGTTPAEGETPRNGPIVFSELHRGLSSWVLSTIEPDGSGYRRLREPAEGVRDYGNDWSPDGTRIAYDRETPRGIWVMRADGSSIERLTSDWALSPQWSPDGTQIAYFHFDSDTLGRTSESAAIWVMDSDGSDGHPVTAPGDDLGIEVDWAPDGRHLLFRRFAPAQPGIYELDLLTSEERLLSPGPEDVSHVQGGDIEVGAPSYSPDGAHVAFDSDRDIWVMARDGSDMRRITSNGPWEGTTTARQPWAEDPSWSPDGASIVYVQEGDIWIIGVDGTNPHPVRETLREEVAPAWGSMP
jgi:Tol biopolymer transport system component